MKGSEGMGRGTWKTGDGESEERNERKVKRAEEKAVQKGIEYDIEVDNNAIAFAKIEHSLIKKIDHFFPEKKLVFTLLSSLVLLLKK